MSASTSSTKHKGVMYIKGTKSTTNTTDRHIRHDMDNNVYPASQIFNKQ